MLCGKPSFSIEGTLVQAKLTPFAKLSTVRVLFVLAVFRWCRHLRAYRPSCLPPDLSFSIRYVEGRFPNLLMHCTKVTGALLTDERIFKEYLVPFRRPESPATATANGVASSGIPATRSGTSGVPAAASAAAAASTAAAAVTAERSAGPEATGQAGAPAANGGAAPSEGDAGGAAAGGEGAASSESKGGGSAQQTVERSEGHPSSRSSLPDGGEGGVSSAAGAAASTAAAAAAAAFASPGKKSATTTPRSGRKSYTAGSAEGEGGRAPPVRVTGQNGPRGEGALKDVLVWNESGMAKSMGCR